MSFIIELFIIKLFSYNDETLIFIILLKSRNLYNLNYQKLCKYWKKIFFTIGIISVINF